MCFDICTINIRVSIRVRGLHLVFLFFSGFCNCVSPSNISCSFFVFFAFLFLGLLGEIFTLTNIHWHSFRPSTFYIDVFIEFTDFGYWAIRENYSKNNSITHLCRHSIGLMFYWYAMVCRGFGSSSLKVWLVFFNLESLKVISNIKHIFFKNGLFKQHFVVQKICLSQSVCSFIKAILYPSRQDSSKEERCFLWKKQLLFCRMPTLFFLATLACHRYSISWRNVGIPLNRHVHFQF